MMLYREAKDQQKDTSSVSTYISCPSRTTTCLHKGFPVSLRQEDAEAMQDEAEEQLDAPQTVGHQKPGKPQPTSKPSCMQIPSHVAGLITVTLSESEFKQKLDTRSGKALHTQLPITVSQDAVAPQPLWLHTSMPTPQTMRAESSGAASPEASATAVK